MDDASIIELYWQRSDQAVSETAAKYGKYCRIIAYNVLSNAEDAEECVNDTYMAAWNSIPPNRPPELSPFLAAICRRIAISRLRKKCRDKRGGGQAETAFEELAECMASPHDVVREIEQKELNLALNWFLSQLAADERDMFVSRYFFAASVAEIAEKFSFSQSKVKTALYRTRKKLRDYLIKEGLC